MDFKTNELYIKSFICSGRTSLSELDSREINNSAVFTNRSLSAIRRELRSFRRRSFRTIAEYQAVDLPLNYKSLSWVAPRESEFQGTCLIVLQLRARVVRSQDYPSIRRELPLELLGLNRTSTWMLQRYLPIFQLIPLTRRFEVAHSDSSNYPRRKESISAYHSFLPPVLSRPFNQLSIRVILLSKSVRDISMPEDSID